MKRVGSALLAGLVALAGGSAHSADSFRYERPVVPGAAGPNRLPVDAALLTGAAPVDETGRGLSDLRLFETGGAEVPYLLIPPADVQAEWRAGALLPIAATEESSGFEIDLGTPQTIDRLRLDGLPAPFLKRARIEASGDRTRWTLIAAETTLFDLPADNLTRTIVEFPAGDFRYLRVLWDDTNSARVRPPWSASARLATPQRPSSDGPRIAVRLERRGSEPGKSRFRLTLPGPNLPVRALELEVGGGHLLRLARVNDVRVSKDGVTRVPLGSHQLRRVVRDNASASDLAIPISRPATSELELVVDDDDNSALELTAVWARLAPLPWIYFESGEDALTARFGSPKLAAPRYDLEAARAGAGTARVATAQWGERIARVPGSETSPLQAFVPEAGGAVDLAEFPYRRPIPDGPPGYTALLLDEAVLAHSNLSDLRIADASGHQVPYLLERTEEPLALALTPLETLPPEKGEERLSHYRLVLPYDSLPPSRLVLRTGARLFERRLSVRVRRPARDARSNPRSENVASATWRHADPGAPAPSLTLDLPPLRTSDATLVVDEGDNRALTLEAPELLLPSYRLRFYRPPASQLTLVYGKPHLSAPRYDLTLIAPQLAGAPAAEIYATVEEAQPAASTQNGRATLSQRTLFWAGLVVAVLVLMAVISRLVRREESQTL